MKKLNIFIENNLLFIIAIFLQILNVVIYLSIKNYNFETFKILNIIILLSASLIKLYKNGDYNFKYMYIFFFVYFVIFFYINFSFENKDTTLLILSRLILPISFLFYLSSFGILFGISYFIFIITLILILNFFITFIPYIIFNITTCFINYFIKKRSS